MSVWSLTCQRRVSKRYHSDKHFSEFYLQDSVKKQLAWYRTKLRHCHPMFSSKIEKVKHAQTPHIHVFPKTPCYTLSDPVRMTGMHLLTPPAYSNFLPIKILRLANCYNQKWFLTRSALKSGAQRSLRPPRLNLQGPLRGREGEGRTVREGTKGEKGEIIPLPPIPGSVTDSISLCINNSDKANICFLLSVIA